FDLKVRIEAAGSSKELSGLDRVVGPATEPSLCAQGEVQAEVGPRSNFQARPRLLFSPRLRSRPGMNATQSQKNVTQKNVTQENAAHVESGGLDGSTDMIRIILVLTLSLYASSALAASCKEQATEKRLAGAALTSFMGKCQRDAQTSCNTSAAEKKLA